MAVLTAVSVVAGSIYTVIRRIQLAKHPAQGVLAIQQVDLQDYSHARVWTENLTAHKRNRIELKRVTQFNLRILVECDNDAMSKREQIMVTVTYKGRKIANRHSLSPGSRHTLQEISTEEIEYEVVKNPESDEDY